MASGPATCLVQEARRPRQRAESPHGPSPARRVRSRHRPSREFAVGRCAAAVLREALLLSRSRVARWPRAPEGTPSDAAARCAPGSPPGSWLVGLVLCGWSDPVHGGQAWAAAPWGQLGCGRRESVPRQRGGRDERLRSELTAVTHPRARRSGSCLSALPPAWSPLVTQVKPDSHRPGPGDGALPREACILAFLILW